MTPLLKPNPESDTSASQPETSRAGETTAAYPGSEQPADPSFGPPVTPGELGRLGHYRVVRVLGRGGMGAIYLATDEQLGREVALKVMLPEAAAVPTARERFLREARAAACIDHDHVVAIHHVGEESGVPFIVMPLLKGETLADRLRRDGHLSAAEATRVGRETALGLAAAHARGLVHRDIKPANIWLEAGSGRVKVLDFGLARPDDTEQQQLTNTGAVMGTPAYMAPEQAAGETIDSRADLFSLGCVLYEAATGRRPFAAPTVMGVLTKIATHTPPPASTIADVPPALSDLITRLLAKQPAGRPQTAAGVAVLLNGPAGPDSAVTTTITPAPPRKPRRWAWVAAAGMSGLLAVAFAGVTVLKIKRDDGTETTVEVPDGAAAKIDAKGNVEIALPKPAAKPVAPSPPPAPPDTRKVAPAPPPVARSPLDALDPAMVPAADRVPGLGDALVAAFGSGERAHWGQVLRGTYSPDGRTVATAGYEGVRLWDAATLAAKGFVPGWASAVEFSPDGKTLAVCLFDWKSCLVDVSGKEPRVTHRLDGVFNRGAFSRDGRRFHVAHPFAAYDLTGPAPKKVLTAFEGQEESHFLHRLADGRYLSWAPAARVFTAWDLSGVAPVKGWELTPPAGLEMREQSATVTPDGKTLLGYVGLGDATALGVWDIGGKGPALVGTHPVADFVGNYFAATPDSARVYLYVNGQPIQVYDRAAKTLTATDLHAAVPLAVSPDGKSLLTASDGSRVGVADGLPNALTPRFSPIAAANAVSVTADGKWFVEMAGERLVTWRVGEPRPAAGAGLDGCHGYCVNPRGPGVAVVRSRGDKSFAEGFDPARPDAPLFSLFVPGWYPVSYNGDRIALAADGDKAVEVWSVAAGQPPAVVAKVAVPDGWGVHPKLSPDNRYLAINEGGWRTAVWRLGGKTPERLPDSPTWRIEFLTGDRAVVVHEGAATVTDLLGKVGVRQLHGPESLGTFAAGPGDAVAVAYDDGSVWVWDAASVTVTRKFQLPGAARALEFAPDGRHLITTNANGTASVLRLEPPPAAARPPVSRLATVDAGEWKVVGAELVQLASAKSLLWFGDEEWADYDLSVEARTASGHDGPGLYFRAARLGHYHGFQIGGYNGTWHELNKHTLGRWSREVAPTPMKYEADRWYTMAVSVRGGRLKCRLDGVLVYDHDDADYPRGRVGLRTWSTAARFRNLRVTDPAGAVL